MHTRVIVKGRREKSPFWNAIEDFGIEWQHDHQKAKDHPKVVAAISKMREHFSIVAVDFRDC